MQISPNELKSMAADIDDLHHESMRTFRDEVGELHSVAATAPGPSRRSLLGKAAVGGAGLAFASAFVPVGRLLSTASAQGLTDVDIAVFAQSVELAAVEAYKAGAPLLSPEVLPVAQLFLGHHQEHAGAFGSLAGDKATGKPNAALVKALTPTLSGLKTQEDVLKFARSVEDQAAATYAFALTVLTTADAYKGTATILPIESAHSAALGLALGESPADQFPTGAFETADIAKGIDPAKYPVA
jgi:hypothetical protein